MGHVNPSGKNIEKKGPGGAGRRDRAMRMAGSHVRTKNRDFHFPLKNAFPRLFFPFSGHKIPQL